jgi:hypothetical protein
MKKHIYHGDTESTEKKDYSAEAAGATQRKGCARMRATNHFGPRRLLNVLSAKPFFFSVTSVSLW